MKQTLITGLVGVICFALGAGVFYGYTQYLKLRQENKMLLEKTMKKESITPTSSAAVSTPSAELSPTVSPTETAVTEKKGTITGTLGYPSSGIPELIIYAFSTTNPAKNFVTVTAENQGTFTINGVDPGTYHVVAYVKDGSGSLSGGYTKSVPCGLTVACSDHSLIDVLVKSGETTDGVAVKDWYAPEGAFPPRPGE